MLMTISYPWTSKIIILFRSSKPEHVINDMSIFVFVNVNIGKRIGYPFAAYLVILQRKKVIYLEATRNCASRALMRTEASANTGHMPGAKISPADGQA